MGSAWIEADRAQYMSGTFPTSKIVIGSAKSIALISGGLALIWARGNFVLNEFPDSYPLALLIGALVGLYGLYIAPWFAALRVSIALLYLMIIGSLFYMSECLLGC